MSTDPFVHDDAAYVLGALEPTERAEFEAHLGTCPACQDRVREARATLVLLGPAGSVPPAGDDAPPDTLLPGLLRRARREQRRRRVLTTSVAVVAAACLVVLVALVAVRPGSSSAPAPRQQALRPLTPVSLVRATAALRPRAWGTEIDVRCRYAHGGAGDDDSVAHPYGLRVVDRDGHAHDAGTWAQAGHGTVVFVGGTEVRRERIAEVQVTLADGTPVLQLTL